MTISFPLLRRVVLWGAPVALALAFFLLPVVDPAADGGFPMDPQRAELLARQLAVREGVALDKEAPWRTYFSLDVDPVLDRFYRRQAGRSAAATVAVLQARRVAPAARVVVTFIPPQDEDRRFVVYLDPEGRPLGLSRNLGDRPLVRDTRFSAEEIAREALGRRFGAELAASLTRVSTEGIAADALSEGAPSEGASREGASREGASSEGSADGGSGRGAEAGEAAGRDSTDGGSSDREPTDGESTIEPEDESGRTVQLTFGEEMRFSLDGDEEEGESERSSSDAQVLNQGSVDESRSEAEATGDGRVSFERTWDELPGLTVEVDTEMEDGRVVLDQARGLLDAATEEELGSSGPVTVLTLVLAWVVLTAASLLAFVWGLWRYWTRLLEREVSHGRTLMLGVLVAVVGGSALYALAAGVPEIHQELEGNLALVVLAVAALLLFPLGLLLGLVWAGCEGDVREEWGRALLPFDAVLRMRWICRPVGAAVVYAIATACWVLLARALVLLPFAASPLAGPVPRWGLFLREQPLQFALSAGLVVLLPYSALGLMGSLSFVRQWSRARRFTLPWSVLFFFLLMIVSGLHTAAVPLGAKIALALVLTLAFWGPLLLFDFLTAGLCFLLYQPLLVLFYYAHQLRAAPEGVRLGALSQTLEVGGGALVLMGILGAVALRFGRDVTEDEVRPGYARNMMERMALSAELSAARQARDRMLPLRSPEVRGARLSTANLGTELSEGDYYDFLPLPNGGVGIAAAAFGREGLAAALRITLARGFLLSWSRRGLPAAMVARRLDVRLEEILATDEAAMLAYGTYDPRRRALQLGFGRRAPVVLLRRQDRGQVEILADDRTEEQEVPEIYLQEGDLVLIILLSDTPTLVTRRRLLSTVRRQPGLDAAETLAELRRRGVSPSTVVQLAAEFSDDDDLEDDDDLDDPDDLDDRDGFDDFHGAAGKEAR